MKLHRLRILNACEAGSHGPTEDALSPDSGMCSTPAPMLLLRLINAPHDALPSAILPILLCYSAALCFRVQSHHLPSIFPLGRGGGGDNHSL